jgi:peptide/nickel transport system substrate-binding protein
MTMTRLALRPPILAALPLLALWACAREAGCPDRWCGTAVVVSSAEADLLLPPVARTDVGVALSDLVFAKLADVGPDAGSVGDSGFVPVLARSWRRDDSVTVSFSLRQQARWHDGTPVTAADVAFTFEVYRDSLVASPARPRLARIAAVTAGDSHTVRFRFREPYPEQLFDAVYHMRSLPRHLLAAVPRASLAAHAFGRSPVGCGPFRFVRWRPGESVELEADPDFVLGRPGLRRVVWRFIPDPSTAVTQVVAGEADVHGAVAGPDDVRRVSEATQLRAVRYPVSVSGFIGFNLSDPREGARPHPLFADRELRRALSMAVDREAVVRAVLGDLGEVPVGPVSRGLWIWSDSIEQLPFDTAAARARLAELGWRDTNRDGVLDRGGRRLAFRLIVPSSSGLRRRAAVVVQDQLRRIGVAREIEELEFNAFLSRARARRFDAYFGAWAQDPSPASIRDTWTSAGLDGFNFGRYANPEADRLVDAALAARDRPLARARWREAIATINADAPAIWLYAPVAVAAVHRRFDNVSVRPDQWAAALWTWRVKPSERIARDLVAER